MEFLGSSHWVVREHCLLRNPPCHLPEPCWGADLASVKGHQALRGPELLGQDQARVPHVLRLLARFVCGVTNRNGERLREIEEVLSLPDRMTLQVSTVRFQGPRSAHRMSLACSAFGPCTTSVFWSSLRLHTLARGTALSTEPSLCEASRRPDGNPHMAGAGRRAGLGSTW